MYFIQGGWSSLSAAAYYNSKEVAEVLLAAGANIDLQNQVLSSSHLVPYHVSYCTVGIGILSCQSVSQSVAGNESE